MLYSRPQLRLLLVLAAILLAGLGVREWRASFPDAADRLERFDREEPAPPLLPSPRPEPRPGSPSPAAPPMGTKRAKPSQETRGEPGAQGVPDPRPLDLNRATVAELARLPGVGPGLARRILDERERRGRFDSLEALRQVLGFGPKKLGAVRALVTVSD